MSDTKPRLGHDELNARRDPRTGSIRSRLLVSALIPIIVLLPLGLRAMSRDLRQWSDAGERTEAIATFAELTALENAVRNEWMSALDIAASSSDGLADESELFRQRTGETFTPEADDAATDGLIASRFAAAVAASDSAFTATTFEEDTNSTNSREPLETVRSRVDDSSIIAAEVDLFYSRFVQRIEDSAARYMATAVDGADGEALAVVDAQAAIGDLTAASADIRRSLSLVVSRILIGGQTDWDEIVDLTQALERADADIAASGFLGSDEWRATRASTTSAARRVESIAESAPSPTDVNIASIAFDLVEARTDLTDAQPAISATRLDLVTTLVATAETERSDALRTLVSSALAVLAGLIVSFYVVSRAQRGIAEPLRDTAALARQVSQGHLPDQRLEARGPTEVREVAATLDDLISTVALIGAQAHALNSSDLDNPALARRLPGELGAELERSIGTWRETTLRLDHELAHDPLTGIASSRRVHQDAVGFANDGWVSIASLTVDRFKDVNDAAGRATGDRLLHLLALRLQRAAPDGVLVGRLWSDEFAIVCADRNLDVIADLADEMRRLAAEPISVGSVRHRLTATVGVAGGDDADEVLTNAAIAVREGKRLGGDVTVRFDHALAADLDRRSEIEAELLEAIEHDALELWFQPVTDSSTGTVVGVESLVRWPLVDGSIRMPDEFVPIAEQSELIVELDKWVLGTACRHLAEWSGGVLADIHIAVNVSARHFVDGDIVGAVRHACESWNVDPSRLAVEITESYLADDSGHVSDTLDQLRDLGVTLLIDDFGTGYSSMSFIQDLPFDVLKIDRAFVSRLNEPSGTAMVEAMVSIAKSMGLLVLAEGVEQEDDIAKLRGLGCHQLQGFGISRPIRAVDDLSKFCTSQERSRVLAATGRHTETT